MSKVLNKLSQEMKKYGYKFKSVSISHLPEIQESVASLVRQGMISEKLHSTWHFYLDSNKNLPEAKTIFIIAIPQFITRAQFEWQRMSYLADFPPGTFVKADESCAIEILGTILKAGGCKVVKAHLALKTLAVRSGLAKYGKNNISYVPGMGSFHRLIALYSDCPCEEDNWNEVSVMKACENCSRCRENCPAQSISADRFLIHAENCQKFSESKKNTDWWLGIDKLHILVGCMMCQDICPANRMNLIKIYEGPIFNVTETRLILNRIPCNKLPPGTRQKLDRLAEDELYSTLTKNLWGLIKSRNFRPHAP